ncbi:MAG: urease accessory protein UreF [Neomegalonema sp.]|nr:urease accessory protein UreF [Neomegalonema sp.]
MTTKADLQPDALLRLASWLSPSFPTSPYAYSHGLEQLVADNKVANLSSFLSWAEACLRHGAGRNDAILLAHAWRATRQSNEAMLQEAAELASALQPSSERRRESLDQGAAFWRTAMAVWPMRAPQLTAPPAYPIAVGVAAAAHDCPLRPTLALYLHSYCGMLTVAGQKLVPLGQTDAQRAIAALNDHIEAVSAEAQDAALEDIGGAAFRADIASMRHETLHKRLYRS